MRKKIVILLFFIMSTCICIPFIHAANKAENAGLAETVHQSVAHEAETDNASGHESATAAVHHAPHIDGKDLSLLWALPFLGILLSIAIFPLLAPHFWHHHYGKVSLFWGLVLFIAFTIGFGPNTSFFYLVETYLGEFIPFITLLLALFTVAGGIRLKGELVGTPRLNTLLIFIGTFLASWMGTTGAAMLMIRPVIRANEWRKHKIHVIIFFIFLVANIGGSLTPLGDPPLFLGFLKGVKFFWTTTHMLPIMGVATVILLALFFVIDTIYYKRETERPATLPGGAKIAIDGKANFILLAGIVGAVIFSGLWHSDINNPADVAITAWGTGMLTKGTLAQVIILLTITVLSVKITSKETRDGNGFSWAPIIEVAKLFATIFITMVMPIAMLKAGVDGPLGAIVSQVTADGQPVNKAFFWATGALSSFLDNAPTYVVFFNTAGGNAAQLMSELPQTLLAISAGAVFMGANTYIGNAPNFMVKS
ncbi:MAG TPA: sodium:proton antiporter, partial [Spirochaetota bacterium]|nr:sodium:proton antiporter [Spirochaetota bacterium]